jgi:hypothetical protein
MHVSEKFFQADMLHELTEDVCDTQEIQARRFSIKPKIFLGRKLSYNCVVLDRVLSMS